MRLHGRNAALPGKGGSFFEVPDARGAGVAGNEADGERAAVEIPHFAARAADNTRSSLDFILVERLAQPCGVFQVKIADENLAGGQAQVADFGDGSAGIVADRDDQSETQRLLALVRGHHGSHLVRREGGRFIPGGCACLCCAGEGVHPQGHGPRGSVKKSSPIWVFAP